MLIRLAMLCALLTAGVAPAQPVDSCRELNVSDPTDAGPVEPISAALTPYRNIPVPHVHLVFVERYGNERTDKWTQLEMQYECAAVRRFETIWGSQQFHDRVTQVKWWIVDDGRNVTGEQLYASLLSHPEITMQVSIKGDGGGWAISFTSGDGTKITHTHIDRPTKHDGNPTRGTYLVGELADNLSHEYTHYRAAGTSIDGGIVDDPRYVSYGVGCLLENLATSLGRCDFDPSRPELWTHKKWVLPTNAPERVPRKPLDW